MRTGLHANAVRNPQQIISYYQMSGSLFFKLLFSHKDDHQGGATGEMLATLRGLGVTIVGRLYTPNQQLSGAERGRFIRDVVKLAERFPEIKYWEGYNELPPDARTTASYSDMEIERMLALEAVGAKAVIGNFSTGTPELAVWPMFRPALYHASRNGHLLGLHEYAGPYMQYMTETPDGKNQWRNGGWNGYGLDGLDSPTLEGWLTLRYRKVRRWLVSEDLASLGIVITEGGIDNTQPRPGGDGSGYKDFSGFSTPPQIGDYAQQRAWYMRQVSHDRYVKGVVDFGFQDASGDWGSFDMSNDARTISRVVALEHDIPVYYHGSEGSMPLIITALRDAGVPAEDLRSSLPTSGQYGWRGLGQVTTLAVHHSGTDSASTTAESMARYHVESNGWSGIGYHFVIKDGVVQYVGDLATARANVYGRNAEVIGVCIPGNYNVETVSVRDVAALRTLYAVLKQELGAPLAIAGHRALAIPGHSTACPGDALALAVMQIAGSPAPSGAPDGLAEYAEAEHLRSGIKLNPDAALQKRILADGYVPTIEEDEYEGYVYQRAESLLSGERRVYFVPKGRWDEVDYISF